MATAGVFVDPDEEFLEVPPVPSIRIMGPRILVLPDPDPEQTKGGLFIPQTGAALHSINKIGTVVAVGQGQKIVKGPRQGTFVGAEVLIGEKVVYLRWMEETGSNPTLGLDGYFILEEKDVLFSFPASANVRIENPAS